MNGALIEVPLAAFGGALLLMAQVGGAIDPITQLVANIGGLGLLIWMVLRQDAIRKTDREQCEKEIGFLRDQIQTLWETLHSGNKE